MIPGRLGAATATAQDYRFDARLSPEVLENYLDRSGSFDELLHGDLKIASQRAASIHATTSGFSYRSGPSSSGER